MPCLLLRPPHTCLDFRHAGLRARDRRQVNARKLVRAELAQPSWKATMSRSAQYVLPVGRGALRLMEDLGAMRDMQPCSVLTRSPLLLRDIS
jgi:hypothetical protein